MAQQLMVVTGHGTFSLSVYTLSGAGGTGLVSITVLCNAPGAPLWGAYFLVAATVGLPPDTFTALWAAVNNSSVTTTVVLEVNGATVTNLSWSPP